MRRRILQIQERFEAAVSMVKHNNQVPNAHFHKDWQRYVKTWFNQPAAKLRRRQRRQQKAKNTAPRPMGLLKPIVRCMSIKYNSKVKAGRGFTLAELAAAKINRKEALGIGIAVDFRRKNRNEEAFQLNVQRLKLYMSKLAVFPRNPTSKRAKKGDASKDELKTVTQNMNKHVFAIEVPEHRVKPMKITKEMREQNVVAILRKARTDGKLWGQREVRAKAKAEKEKEAALKKAKKGRK